MNNVAVLLSSYNGEDFILELLESLENQTYRNFDLIIRDDGSNDSTREIISSFKRSSIPVIVITDNDKDEVAELSLSSSFLNL